MKVLNYSSRENGRTPMQWDATEHAGFMTGTPWKRVNPNYKEINVALQEGDPNSVLTHFKKMTALRTENPVLVYGSYALLQPEHEEIYAYTRELDGKKFLVLLNFSETESDIELEELKGINSENVIINNYTETSIKGISIFLKPYQAIIYSI